MNNDTPEFLPQPKDPLGRRIWKTLIWFQGHCTQADIDKFKGLMCLDDTPADAMKPCPVSWCDDPRPQKFTSGNLHYIRCNECQTKTPLFYSSTQAIAAWNTRTTSLAAQDGLVDALRKISSGRSSVTECSLIARAALASIEVKS